jgi:hypothetical protein
MIGTWILADGSTLEGIFDYNSTTKISERNMDDLYKFACKMLGRDPYEQTVAFALKCGVFEHEQLEDSEQHKLE